ncbi:E3 ubiquitin-protein ligase Topors [Camelus dromedarius]|uniref:E3 ubiquitin-protein ligase Topors n=1 Tax=Camelus dromedarius TaxID=9838 RepID=A0A5N4BZY8_CAMDR|nr:E3 ubiquitin-protein ligase Topors [Camelus dromedarius]
MSGYTPDEKLRQQQLRELRRRWLKDQELSAREPVLPSRRVWPVEQFWNKFLQDRAPWKNVIYKSYRHSVFAFTHVLIPVWIIHYYLKYHVNVAAYVAKVGILVTNSDKRRSGGEYTKPPLRKKRKSVSSRKRRSRVAVQYYCGIRGRSSRRGLRCLARRVKRPLLPLLRAGGEVAGFVFAGPAVTDPAFWAAGSLPRAPQPGLHRHPPSYVMHAVLVSDPGRWQFSTKRSDYRLTIGVIMASAAKEFKMDNFSPKAGTSKLQQTVPADASPDSKCPICLDRFDNVSYLDRCLHKFCFRCVQEWSKNKAECPLCKQPFDSIFHSVRAEDDFKEYVLRPSYNGSFATPDVRRFRYRTTMTRERSASVYSPSSAMNRRTTTPPDSGVLFEGLSISGRPRDGEIPPFMRQIAVRRPATADERSLRKIQEQDIINFRRTLYRAGARVRNIEDGGRYRDISAEFFRRNPACLHRLVPWLKRELTVLFGAHGSLVNIVQHIIMSNVTRYDLESQAFVSDLRPFLLNRTEHFIHEFISFARSPFNMAAFDQHANYDCPAPSYEEGSHSDSSVITISPDEAETQELDINIATVSQAPWDDETPGPSYSSSEQVHAAMSSLLNTSDSSDEELVTGRATQMQGVQTNEDLNNDSDSSSDNCVIVGFVKPLAERTPELVELSSDSEELGSYEKMETVKTQEQEQSYSSGDSDVSLDRVRNEKPGGKRKYKTRHLEGMNEVAQPSREFASKVKESHYQKSSSKLDGNCKNESDSFSDSRSSDRETKRKRRKRRTRSLSVEIVFEGKATDTARHHKKKKKKHKKKHKKHHGDSASRSPVVITIDSDSDKDSEVKVDTGCDLRGPQDPLQNEFVASSLEPFETKDIVTIEDEFGVLGKECDINTLNNLNNANKTVDNILPQTASIEQTLDVREESAFASDLENQSSDVSIQTEPSRHLPSPRTSLMSVSLGRDHDMS